MKYNLQIQKYVCLNNFTIQWLLVKLQNWTTLTSILYFLSFEQYFHSFRFVYTLAVLGLLMISSIYYEVFAF